MNEMISIRDDFMNKYWKLNSDFERENEKN